MFASLPEVVVLPAPCDLSKCVRGENLDTGDRQLTIPDVSNRYLETTNEYERLKVEIYKDLLVELYDFAYQQAKKTDSVDELLDIATGESVLDGGMREGLVFRSQDGIKSFKAVSNEFLLRFHS